jgi:maltokinase
MSNPVSTDQLQPLVATWLPTQRWFGGKGRDATIIMRELAKLPDTTPQVTLWVADVHYADGSSEAYQVPLVRHEQPAESLEHVLLGSLVEDGRVYWVYDALHDKTVTAAWLAGVREERVAGPLRFTRLVEPDLVPVDEPSLALTVEQSNTSLMFGAKALLKVFRRLLPGINPDIEVHTALGAEGAKHIAKLLGFVDATVDGERYALAMVQEYLTSATDGWALATASVRDLMAEGDLHAAEAGGDFAGEAHRLGEAVAEVHAELALAFGTAVLDSDGVRERAAAMHARLDHAAAVVPQLGDLSKGLGELFDAFAALGGGATVQRIHGDLHLAQALRTVERWVVIDFEGEPLANLEARRAFDTPLRDVAGMLRSFEYAGYHRVVETQATPQLNYRASEWAERNRGAFCDGYAEAIGADPREQSTLLRAYEADKAVYESVYESRNRPTWLPIPLVSLTRLAEGVQ